MRDEHYKIFSARLSDEVTVELQKRRQNYKSWNLLFRQLLGIKTQLKLSQKKK